MTTSPSSPQSRHTTPRTGRARRRPLFATRVIAVAALSGAGLLATAPSSHADPARYHVKVLATGVAGATKPDDVTLLGTSLFVGFQNGVGSTGGAASNGTTTSTIAQYRKDRLVASWSIPGKCDGLGADPVTGLVIATVNEDGNSSLYTIDPTTGLVVHYTYSPDPSSRGGGGTDAVSVQNGRILISGSAPITASAPAMYAVSLDASTRVATLTSVFADNATATGPSGSVTLALTDPDSNTIVPSSSPLYAGDVALNSQGDQQVLFVANPTSSSPTVAQLNLGAQIDDLTWVTSTEGSLLMTDNSTNTIYEISGDFTPGTVFVDTASDSNVPGTLSTLDLSTGTVTPILSGFANPHGLIFIPSSH